MLTVKSLKHFIYYYMVLVGLNHLNNRRIPVYYVLLSRHFKATKTE